MKQMGFLDILSFGPDGWGYVLMMGALVSVALAVLGFLLGAAIGVFAAWAKISGGRTLRAVADGYTTIIRGIPDLLVIYLFYFGGSAAVTALGKYFGAEGFIGFPGFLAGVLAIAIPVVRTTPKCFVVHSGPFPKVNSKPLLLAAWARC